MTTETTKVSREIPAENLGSLTTAIAKLNKRASRLKVTSLTLAVVDRREVECEDKRTKLKFNRVFLTVEITGESPVLAGWELTAKITSTKAGNLAKSVPGKSCPVEFRTVKMGRCDHCHTNRLRNDTFVVHNMKSGEYKVVGRKCIGDFLGHKSPEALLNGAEILWAADELSEDAMDEGFGWGGGSCEIVEPIERYVGTCSIWIRKFGWVSRGASGDDLPSTSGEVWSFLHPFSRAQQEYYEKLARDKNIVVSEEDTELTMMALAWARALLADVKNDYLYNLRVACTLETVTYRTMGLVASLIPTYKREVEQEEIKRQERKTKRRGHVGAVKERRGFPGLLVVGVSSHDGQYGMMTLVRFENAEGDLLLWWASGDFTEEYEVGDSYDVTATVKAHDHHEEFGNQTILTRVKESIDSKKFDDTGAPRPKKSRKTKNRGENQTYEHHDQPRTCGAPENVCSHETP